MNSFIKYNTLSILWTACILIGCLLPGRDLPDVAINISDKAIHFTIYFLLSIFTYYGWIKQNSFYALHRNTILKIVFLTSIYGFIVEILQHILTTDRYFDLYDALANSTGAIAGCMICIFLKPMRSQKGRY